MRIGARVIAKQTLRTAAGMVTDRIYESPNGYWLERIRPVSIGGQHRMRTYRMAGICWKRPGPPRVYSVAPGFFFDVTFWDVNPFAASHLANDLDATEEIARRADFALDSMPANVTLPVCKVMRLASLPLLNEVPRDKLWQWDTPTGLGWLRWGGCNHVIGELYRYRDIRDGVEAVFGSRHRPLVRAVAERIIECDTRSLLIAWLLADAVPVERLPGVLADQSGRQGRVNAQTHDLRRLRRGRQGRVNAQTHDLRRLRRALATYSPDRAIRILADARERRTLFLIEDTAKMLGNLRGRRWKDHLPSRATSLREIHDRLAVDGGMRPGRGNALLHRSGPIKAPDWLAPIHGATVGDLELRIPAHTDDLHTIADALSNCVWMYGHEVLGQRTNIVAAWRGDKPVYCLEVRNSTLTQFSGFANTPAPRDDVMAVTQEMSRLSPAIQVSSWLVDAEEFDDAGRDL